MTAERVVVIGCTWPAPPWHRDAAASRFTMGMYPSRA
jgi:hypothetical protein